MVPWGVKRGMEGDLDRPLMYTLLLAVVKTNPACVNKQMKMEPTALAGYVSLYIFTTAICLLKSPLSPPRAPVKFSSVTHVLLFPAALKTRSQQFNFACPVSAKKTQDYSLFGKTSKKLARVEIHQLS